MRNLFYSFFILYCFLFGITSFAQNKAIDVQAYQFHIGLNDSTNVLRGKAKIRFKARSPLAEVSFDLIQKKVNAEGGMEVSGVQDAVSKKPLKFSQKHNQIIIALPQPLNPGEEGTVSITYHGIPEDGLIISKNKFGERTFFADNWPERARYWIPTNDHPSDKARVEFLVTAPNHYQVVGNGIKVETVNLPHNRLLTHWKSKAELPTKVMAIGVANFGVHQYGASDGIPISAWVFTENREAGYKEYAAARKILPFFSKWIGPYPFKKLANVQSKTRFGGMEDASNIFYYENSVYTDTINAAGKQQALTALMAHEIAHQWFGDDITEKDWPHLWLSEGFATFFADIYMKHRYGEKVFLDRIQKERAKALRFYKTRKAPVVDSTAKHHLMQMLNPNSYEKGGWVLRMLQEQLGKDIFQTGIRKYYAEYKGKNAHTEGFQKIMEKVSHKDLSRFFQQWLYTAGHPILKGDWTYLPKEKIVKITLHQEQPSPFKFPLEIGYTDTTGTHTLKREIKGEKTVISFPVKSAPKAIQLDPNTRLFFQGELREKS